MHVLLVILGGSVLLGVFLLFGYLWDSFPAGSAAGAKVFVPVWVVVAVANLWVGVTKAGYGLREELPILLIVTAVPVALAGLFIWRSSQP